MCADTRDTDPQPLNLNRNNSWLDIEKQIAKVDYSEEPNGQAGNRLPIFENNLFIEGQSVVDSEEEGDDKLIEDNISNNSAFRLH